VKGWLPPLADRGFLVTTGMLVIGAFLLRVYQLGKQELWIDEALSFYTTTTRVDLDGVLLAEYTPPLYNLLLWRWGGWVGTSEANMRMLSVIFGTLFILAVIWAGATFFNRRVGLWAGAFAAIAPIHIYYSQEARAYALLVLVLMLSSVLLWRALRLQTPASWVMATTTGMLALYTHYFAILALLPTTFMVLIGQHRQHVRQTLVRLGVATLVCALVYTPLLYWHLVRTNHSRAELGWIQSIWEATPPALAIPYTLEVFGLGSQAGFLNNLVKVYPYVTFPSSLRLLGFALLLILGIWVAIPWKDDQLQISFLRDRKIWLWTMLFLPLGTLWLVSFYQPLYTVGRYDLVAFPAYTLLMGLAMAKLQGAGRTGPLLTLCVTMAFSLLVGTKLVQYYQLPPRPPGPWPSARSTAATLLPIVRNGDVVVFTGLRGLQILYYFSREGFVWVGENCENQEMGRRFGCRMFPLETEKTPATGHVSIPLQAVRDDLRIILSALSEPGGTLWIVFNRGSYRGGRLLVPQPDSFLVDELQRMDFHFTPADLKNSKGIFAFTR